MKLYVNKERTRWAGTQIDAKKEFGIIEPYEVPTDKTGLLEFLNGAASLAPEPIAAESREVASYNEYSKPNSYPQNDSLVGRCNMIELKELSTMMHVILNRTWNEMDREGVKNDLRSV
tara:strand:+ start:882 stop:1235 length:354 start_codon:yes stop_codon:yes gene_type:complete